MSLARRIFTLLEAHLTPISSRASVWELKENLNNWDPSHDTTHKQPHTDENTYQYQKNDPTPKPTSTLTTDLELFELEFPTTLKQLTQKRNALLQTYHPDRFEYDAQKKQVATEMIQIINQAYERLRPHLR